MQDKIIMLTGAERMIVKAITVILITAMMQTIRTTIARATMSAAVVATTPAAGAATPKLIVSAMEIIAVTSRVVEEISTTGGRRNQIVRCSNSAK